VGPWRARWRRRADDDASAARHADGLPTITGYPFNGAAIEIWDSGPGHTQPPSLTNTAPVDTSANQDPHEDPRNTPAAQQQVSDFLQPNGMVTNVCAGTPCHSSDYTP
jgi:hypothetical protein